MADRCEDLMGKYEFMLRKTTQVEISVGIMRSRFETYPPQQFDLTDVLDTPITLGSHVVASRPRNLEERIESCQDWDSGWQVWRMLRRRRGWWLRRRRLPRLGSTPW